MWLLHIQVFKLKKNCYYAMIDVNYLFIIVSNMLNNYCTQLLTLLLMRLLYDPVLCIIYSTCGDLTLILSLYHPVILSCDCIDSYYCMYIYYDGMYCESCKIFCICLCHFLYLLPVLFDSICHWSIIKLIFINNTEFYKELRILQHLAYETIILLLYNIIHV